MNTERQQEISVPYKPPILAIDPGPEKSGWVLLSDSAVCGSVELNTTVCQIVRAQAGKASLAIEWVESFGMAVGADIHETTRTIGRFEQAWYEAHGGWEEPWIRVPRREVKLHLCGQMKATDSNIRQALIDLWGGDREAVGGAKCPNCKGKGWRGRGRPTCEVCGGSGWEHPPGPLHDVSSHQWAALAVAVTARHKIDSEADYEAWQQAEGATH